jgi:hypothetical protein
VARIDEWFGRSNRRSGLPVSKNVWMKRRKLAALPAPQLALLSSRHMLNSSFNLQLNLEKKYHPCRNPPWRRGTNRPRNTWHRGGSVEDLNIIFVNILNKINPWKLPNPKPACKNILFIFKHLFLIYHTNGACC